MRRVADCRSCCASSTTSPRTRPPRAPSSCTAVSGISSTSTSTWCARRSRNARCCSRHLARHPAAPVRAAARFTPATRVADPRRPFLYDHSRGAVGCLRRRVSTCVIIRRGGARRPVPPRLRLCGTAADDSRLVVLNASRRASVAPAFSPGPAAPPSSASTRWRATLRAEGGSSESRLRAR